MKIRQGFVSNSSTSSFILIGRKSSNEELIEEYKKLDNYIQEYVDDLSYYEMCEALDNFYILGDSYDDVYKGELLADWSDDYLGDEEFDLNVLIDKIKDIKNPKLFYGTYAS